MNPHGWQTYDKAVPTEKLNKFKLSNFELENIPCYINKA